MSSTRSAPPAVVCEGVSKTFRTPHERRHTLKERALHPFRRSGYKRFEALKDVSFAIDRGEFFGIVGRNGSGKSTLLKILAGIYRADGGQVYMNGRVSTFIELGVGFNLDLAARDNVVINGVMLGLSPRQALERYDRVIAFAELEEFADLKLKNYSSGMQVRLAFSVMIQVDADILIIDEVLAVGDAAFQQKCFDVFNRLRDEGKTILFVTHDMAAVQRFCHRAMLLERGEQRMIGEPERVAAEYVEVNFGRDRTSEPAKAEEPERYGDGMAEIVDAWFTDDVGEPTDMLRQGESCGFHARVRFHTDVQHPAIAVLLENDRHHPVFATSTEWIEERTGSFAAGDEVVFTVEFRNWLAPGRLYASPWVVYRGGGNLMDRRPRMASVVVTGTKSSGAIVDLPHDIALEHGDRRLAGKAQG
jgi:ABC-type polysaccharide/polyol phosphate transport system ATPase subunit